jgi:hypothetical protein
MFEIRYKFKYFEWNVENKPYYNITGFIQIRTHIMKSNFKWIIF